MGAVKAVCGDISEYMLTLAQENSKVAGYDSTRIIFVSLMPNRYHLMIIVLIQY